MRFKKKPASRQLKKANIHKEVIEQIKETERKMKEKIVHSRGKKQRGDK